MLKVQALCNHKKKLLNYTKFRKDFFKKTIFVSQHIQAFAFPWHQSDLFLRPVIQKRLEPEIDRVGWHE